MIDRTIYSAVLHSISLRPVTLITGARQVGKTTLCIRLKKERGYEYVSLRDKDERASAKTNPKLFLSLHPWPLIIDEVQYVPGLMECIESVVENEKVEGKDTNGMYVLTGSQVYSLMDKATDSLAGRISLIKMSPLSLSEVLSREEVPFAADVTLAAERSKDNPLTATEVFDMILRGMYPEPVCKKDLSTKEFYSDYVDTYIERDVCDIVRIQNKEKFHSFMQLMASLTGQELNQDKIASEIGIDNKTVKSWISVLIAGDIIHLLQPHYDTSVTKRVIRKPKMYFWDTGLACYLARILDRESLIAGYLKGPMVETFIVNEILKTYRDNKDEAPFYFYRDTSGEIDLVMISKGHVNLIECKSGTEFGWNDVKNMKKGIQSQYPIGTRCIVCLSERVYPLNDDVYVIPLSSI